MQQRFKFIALLLIITTLTACQSPSASTSAPPPAWQYSGILETFIRYSVAGGAKPIGAIKENVWHPDAVTTSTAAHAINQFTINQGQGRVLVTRMAAAPQNAIVLSQIAPATNDSPASQLVFYCRWSQHQNIDGDWSLTRVDKVTPDIAEQKLTNFLAAEPNAMPLETLRPYTQPSTN